MRQVSIVLALGMLAGCAGETASSATGGGITSAEDPPDTGALDPSTGGPSLPTTDGSTTTADVSTGADTTTSGGPTTGEVDPATSGEVQTTGEASTTGTTDDSTTGGPPPVLPWAPKPCPAIYAQDLLPTFEIELGADELAALEEEWLIADDTKLSEHAVKSFKYENVVITDATVRLRGNASHWPEQNKMQFEFSFDTNDPEGRFLGLKRVLLDAATFNRSFLRDRLALAIMRDAGVAAPCANNARLVLNGDYYGLFTNLEKVNKQFLKRNFENPDGNLYKRRGTKLGWERKTNEEDLDLSDITALKAADDLSELQAVMNLDQALLEWAAEAVVPNRDGAWAGGLNLYVYNDPLTGFNVIPWDLDDSFTRLPYDTDPYTYQKPPEVFWGRPFYEIATADPVWFAKYIDAIDHVVHTAYDVTVLQDRIDTWAAQIATAAAEDKNKPFSTSEHIEQVANKRSLVAKRAAFLDKWLKCWKEGGTKGGDGKCVPG